MNAKKKKKILTLLLNLQMKKYEAYAVRRPYIIGQRHTVNLAYLCNIQVKFLICFGLVLLFGV